MIRGFKICKGFEDQQIQLPQRSTKHSAGYDFQCAQTVTVPPIWKLAAAGEVKPTMVKTGIKAYMKEDEALFLYNRSSNPIKKGLIMANSVGIVDSDYFENPDNDGHIMFAFYNFYPVAVTIEKGERIGQGIFQPYFKADGDQAQALRQGGFGSTK